MNFRRFNSCRQRSLCLTLGLERLEFLLGSGKVFDEGRGGLHRVAACGGADFHAILADVIESDQSVLVQRPDGGDALRTKPVAVVDVEVGQGMVIDEDVATDPTVRGVAATELREAASAIDAFVGGEQPKGDEDADIDGGLAGMMHPSLVAEQEAREVEGTDLLPSSAGRVVGRDELVDGAGIEKPGAIGVAEADVGSEIDKSGIGGGDCRIHGRRV